MNTSQTFINKKLILLQISTDSPAEKATGTRFYMEDDGYGEGTECQLSSFDMYEKEKNSTTAQHWLVPFESMPTFLQNLFLFVCHKQKNIQRSFLQISPAFIRLAQPSTCLDRFVLVVAHPSKLKL